MSGKIEGTLTSALLLALLVFPATTSFERNDIGSGRGDARIVRGHAPADIFVLEQREMGGELAGEVLLGPPGPNERGEPGEEPPNRGHRELARTVPRFHLDVKCNNANRQDGRR